MTPSAEQQIKRLEETRDMIRDTDECDASCHDCAWQRGVKAITDVLTLLASLSQELERIRTEHEDLQARSGKPDVDRDFSIHAPTDTDDTERCPRCGSERVRVIHELFGAGPRNYCDDCKDIWAIQAPSIYWAHDEPESDDAVARPDGETLDGLRAQNSFLRRALATAEQSLETVKGEREQLRADLEKLREAKNLPPRLASCCHSFGEWCDCCVGSVVRDFNDTRKQLAAILRERPQEPQ